VDFGIQFPAAVAMQVSHAFLLDSEQRSQRYGQDHIPASHCTKILKRCTVIFDVFQHIDTGHQIELLPKVFVSQVNCMEVGVWQTLTGKFDPLRRIFRACDLGLRILIQDLLEQQSRTAACIQNRMEG
jgi:hypothetical protein